MLYAARDTKDDRHVPACFAFTAGCVKANCRYAFINPLQCFGCLNFSFMAANAPTKQDEEHYSVRVFTEPKLIYDIYKNCTKSFGIYKDEEDYKKKT